MGEIQHEGGCLCGALRYRLNGDPVITVVCHCGQCQKQSGSAHGMTMVVRRTAFEWLAGSPRVYEALADSGTKKKCLFCGDCGARILNELDSLPETYNLKPGTLDDRSWFTPIMHTWVSAKQPWTVIPEGVTTFDRNPGS